MAIKPRPYVPSFIRAALSGSRPIQLTFSDVSDTNILSTSSFIYDPPNHPLKNTQQLNLDWSKFENHTFFMSAEAKVNIAFEQIINGYPFDGSRKDVETFFDKLTGFDRWVFDQFPKFHGQLHFSGSQVGETSADAGTHIIVRDHAGSLYPEISRTRSGESVLNPKDGSSFSVEMQLYVPDEPNAGTQTVFQKMSGSTHGFGLYLLPNAGSSSIDAQFCVVSGTTSTSVITELNKGKFNHICVALNRETGAHYLEFFKRGESVAISKHRDFIGDMDIDGSDLVIGSGSVMSFNNGTITPTQTLSGTLDELRVFHSARTAAQQQAYASKSIFATPDLKLYYRFNEPPPPLATLDSDSVNAIVIDSSGNALHALVSNFTDSLREDSSEDPKSNIIYEKEETVPVLFPANADVIELNTTLLLSASAYDRENPNLITKLIPQHYLLEGAAADGFTEIEGNGGAPYGGSGIPGQGSLGNVQVILSFLYIWARFFDEMKLYVDSFSTLRYVDYETNDTTPNNFLYDLVKQYGFHLPPLFNDATLEQYIRAENIGQEISTFEHPLKHVQNQLLRRVLVNMPDVMKSKGTQHSIKSFLRSLGIDPENSMRLREYGGPTSRQLSFARETKREVSAMIEFSSSSFVVSPFLSASRLEPGHPTIAGTFVNQTEFPPYGISNNPNDGLLTSGSWTVEGIVRYTKANTSAMGSATQSLARMCVTGTMSSEVGLIANLIAVSSSINPVLTMYFRPGDSVDSPLLSMSIYTPTPGIFDGDRWNFSFGCERNDSVGSIVSSSYFLRLATQNDGNVEYYRTTSSFFYERANSFDKNVLRTLTTSSNTSGTFFSVGPGQIIASGSSSGFRFLNNTSVSNQESRELDFRGRMSNLRFWSKALTEVEWREHVRNFRSLGVVDPLVNYNFVKTREGSFEKVRFDSLTKQETRRANATASLGTLGSVTFLDFTKNGFHLTGSGFPTESDCIRSEIFDHGHISARFDEASTNEKIRVRGFLNQDMIDSTPWAGLAPQHEIVKSERPTDDVRFSVDFSLIDALDRDIITLFATLDAIDNALGSPELMYSPDYPDLERLRDVYFNRISEKLNFRAFFEFFRWFDTSIGTFIEQLIPRKTKFKGTNFVVESHMLERHKIEYFSNEMYLGDSTRNRIQDVLVLQLITGDVRKY